MIKNKGSNLFIHSFMQCLGTHLVPDTVLGLGLGMSTDRSPHPFEFYLLKQRKILLKTHTYIMPKVVHKHRHACTHTSG